MTNPKEVLAHYQSEWESRVMNMKPGPKMNHLVGERVMGWTFDQDDDVWIDENGLGLNESIWNPSEEISDAWDVLRHLKGYHIELVRHRGVWTAALDDGKRSFVVRADSAPEAICKVALLAVGVSGG